MYSNSLNGIDELEISFRSIPAQIFGKSLNNSLIPNDDFIKDKIPS